MDDSKRNAVKFLEKEIKTYMALSLFLAKRGIDEHVCVGDRKILISPTFYKRANKGSEENCRRTQDIELKPRKILVAGTTY